MRNLFVIVLFSVLVIVSPGCKDWLDIQPESEIVLEDFWQNESQAMQVVAACYRSLTEDASIRRMIVWGEARSDNMVEGNSTNEDLLKILEADINASNSFTNWGAMYQTINYCNTFLYYGKKVTEVDENFTMGKYQALMAEVLTIRALVYFYLVRTYKEVPLILEPSIDDTQNYQPAKATEREILDQIITDLRTAEPYARNNFDAEKFPKARVTKNVVRSLLADVYLWDQQYNLCVDYCNKVLADEELELYNAEFFYTWVYYLGSSDESIFELPFKDQEMRNTAVRSLYGYFGDVSGQLSFPPFLVTGSLSPFAFQVGVDKESVNDIRLKDFVNVPLGKKEGYYYIFKYTGIQRTENLSGDDLYDYRSSSPSWIVYRLSDVILMKAEALVQLNRNEGDLREALALVNKTYLRSNPDLENDSLQFSLYNSPSVMESLVLRERHREFLFEGKRWFDLVRLARRDGSTEKVLTFILPKFSGGQSLQYTKMTVLDALYYPIPQDELDSNPNLVQNPFYELTGSNN